MLHAKTFELRDRGTFIPIVAVSCKVGDGANVERYEADEYLLRRSGYRSEYQTVLLTRLDGSGKAHCDPYDWEDRTFKTAHNYIQNNWDALTSGDVIDVEFILGETTTPKISEAYT
jgi:hypothetical protein